MTNEQLFNASEQQLADFCEKNRINKMQLSIKAQGDLPYISPVGLNMVVVSVKKAYILQYYNFGCIRLHIYDKLYKEFDMYAKRKH